MEMAQGEGGYDYAAKYEREWAQVKRWTECEGKPWRNGALEAIVWIEYARLSKRLSLKFLFFMLHIIASLHLDCPWYKYLKFLHLADYDVLAFADTPENLLFRPEGSLVEQNLSNGKSYLSEIMRKIYLSGQFFNGSRVIRKCPAGGQLQDQPHSSKWKGHSLSKRHAQVEIIELPGSKWCQDW